MTIDMPANCPNEPISQAAAKVKDFVLMLKGAHPIMFENIKKFNCSESFFDSVSKHDRLCFCTCLEKFVRVRELTVSRDTVIVVHDEHMDWDAVWSRIVAKKLQDLRNTQGQARLQSRPLGSGGVLSGWSLTRRFRYIKHYGSDGSSKRL
ncbi:hypothetical protein H2200_000144 [Cladophialophora chaetospira]|uniref:Uncharacterized protein n=1 Tax=Cladophialophora chaetospira TaxID=386627 RepID=A0AA38XN74_9EURO|nr:hypothetical protein H2200_000144 [Cladophialophora chaetospira]